MSEQVTDRTSDQCWDGLCEHCDVDGCEHHCHYERAWKWTLRRIVLLAGLTAVPFMVASEFVDGPWLYLAAIWFGVAMSPVAHWLDGGTWTA